MFTTIDSEGKPVKIASEVNAQGEHTLKVTGVSGGSGGGPIEGPIEVEGPLTAEELAEAGLATESKQDALLAALQSLAPATRAEAVVPSDTVDLTYPSRAIWVGTGGDVAAVIDGQAIVHKNVPSGTRLDIRATRINATGTTASDMVAWS